MAALRTMEAQRHPLYRAAADAVVPNTGTLEDALIIDNEIEKAASADQC